MRKGETGDWVNHLTPDQVERIKKWEEDNLVESSFQFTYQIKNQRKRTNGKTSTKVPGSAKALNSRLI